MQYPFSVVLASASPRRIALLQSMGVDALVYPADIDESPRNGEEPERLVRRLAATKAITSALSHPEAVVLGADTVVALGQKILGKPGDAEDAAAMLAQLSGKSHQVYTGMAVYRQRSGIGFVDVEVATVTFRTLTGVEIARYVDTGEPMDKAGAYAIQGGAGPWVKTFEGNLETVIGLATGSVRSLFHRFARSLEGAGSHV